MALCFDHPLCYRNNSTTIKKYGYNSKPSISGAKFVVGKYGSGSDKRYYLCESSSAASSNKLATVSGSKYYVNSGYVDLSFYIFTQQSGSWDTVYLGLSGFWGGDLDKVTVSNGGLKDSGIEISYSELRYINGEGEEKVAPYIESQSSYTLSAGTTQTTVNRHILAHVSVPRFSSFKSLKLNIKYSMGGTIRTVTKTYDVSNVVWSVTIRP